MPDIHNPYGGSTMSRTLNCPSWRKLSADIPPAPAGEAALDGTKKHDCMEWIYSQDDTAQALLTASVESDIDDFDTSIALAYGAMERLFDQYNVADYMVEPFVQLIPNLAGGSIDMLALSEDGKTAIIADYKMGHNTVKAANNAQLQFYAICAINDKLTSSLFKHVDKVVCAIIQPNDDGDVLDVWETTIEDLADFERDVRLAIEAAEQGTAEPKSGSHCRFCPAQAVCPVKTGLAQQAQRLPAAQVEILNEALAIIPELEDWIKAVRKLAYETLERGVPVEGFKLVNKRPSRVWSDEQGLLDFCFDQRNIGISEPYEQKLKSPAQMEKLFKEKGIDPSELSDYITSVSSGTTIAPASDKRPDATPTLALQALADRLA